MQIPTEAVRIVNLSDVIDLERRFDLVISLEAAEHVDAKFERQFVENLTRAGDTVLFAAAIPFQGGYRHVNERWPSHWQAIFDDFGFQAFDPLRSLLWDDPDVHFWYKQNMLLYVRRERGDLLDAVENFMARQTISPMPIDVVQPELFEAIASYSQIAFRPLLRELPRRALQKVAAILNRKT